MTPTLSRTTAGLACATVMAGAALAALAPVASAQELGPRGEPVVEVGTEWSPYGPMPYITDCSARYSFASQPAFWDPWSPLKRVVTSDGQPRTIHCALSGKVPPQPMVLNPDGTRTPLNGIVVAPLLFDPALGIGSAGGAG